MLFFPDLTMGISWDFLEAVFLRYFLDLYGNISIILAIFCMGMAFLSALRWLGGSDSERLGY